MTWKTEDKWMEDKRQGRSKGKRGINLMDATTQRQKKQDHKIEN